MGRMGKILFFVIFILILNESMVFGNGFDVPLISGMKPEDGKNMVIAGLSMSKFGLVNVINYLLIEPNTLVVYGQDNNYDNAISLIDLQKRTATQIKKYSDTAILQARLLGFNNEYQSKILGFIILYDVNRAGQKFEETDTYVEIFIKKNSTSFMISGPEKIAEARIAHYRYTDSKKYKYLYYAPDEEKPARKATAKIFLRDIDHDGDNDMVIWKKKYVSRLITERRKGDFKLKDEEIYVMTLDQTNLNYSTMKKIDKLTFGKENLWNVLNPRQYFTMP